MNRLTLTFAALLLSLSVAAESKWIDITNEYVKNPRYDNNDLTTGWEGTTLGAYNPKENAEHYQKEYDTYQVIKGIPAGHYRVSLNAFYRQGQSSDDYNHYTTGKSSEYEYARLYAESSVGKYDVGIKSSSEGKSSENLGGDVSGIGNRTNNGWWTTYEYYVPNNMEAAYNWFQAGYYKNEVECEVGDDGTLKIGIRKDITMNGDWTCIDNWKLEYYGEQKMVNSISFEKDEIEMVIGEKLQLTPIIAPIDALIQTVKWESSNSRVSIDENGLVTANVKGTSIVTATAKDGSNVFGSVKITITSNNPSSENIVINEIMAANIDIYLDPNQNYGSWVELYNPTDRAVNLEGLYVSDDRENLTKHKLVKGYGSISAHGYAILNFDHHEVWTKMSYRQIDDKLNCEGGKIIVSDGTTIFAEQDYPAAIGRISYARTTDGGDEWGYSGNPTPEASNTDGKFAVEQLDAPTVDKNTQLFDSPMQICVNIPLGATLRYTIDGTAPTLTNGETSETGIFSIDATTVFRFRVFKDGYLPSMVVTRSYIQNSGNEPFPIINIVTDNDNIYSSDRGAFMQGQYGRPGNGQDANCNWNMDWDRPVNFEYITTDNECVVSQECDFSMCGGWSRAWTPHSFKLKATKLYDFQNTFDHQFFSDKTGLKHKTLQIRNGGNDSGCRIKDGAIQGIITQDANFYVDYQAWQPVHVFINGKPYNILNMREPNNKHHAYTNYGIDTDEMDQFEMSPDSGYVQMEGTKESINRWLELSNTVTEDASYEEIKTLVDLDEYINYMACELYLGNWDWPQNNVKGFRDRNNGKFHFVLFDLDGSLSTDDPFTTMFGKETYTFDVLRGYDYSKGQSIQGQKRTRPIEFVTIFRNMLKNDDFRKRFIDAYCIVNGSLFDPDRARSIISERATYLSQGSYVNPWGTANDLMNKFTSTRQNTLISRLIQCNELGINTKNQIQCNLSSNIKEGQIFINDQVLPTGKIKGAFFSPAILKAIAPAGYKFTGWKGNTGTKLITSGSEWKYYDNGSLDAENWKASDYNDKSWKAGNAPIGYGKDESTTTTKNLPTYYFRKEFNLDNTPTSGDKFTLDYTIDDGMIIYINGVEAGRYNMPAGNVKYDNVASTYANNNPDTGSMEIKSSLFQQGKNVIAVEVHNNQATSSDILWNCELKLTPSSSNQVIVSTEPVFDATNVEGNLSLIATWEKMTEEEMVAEGLNTCPIVINEISAANSVYVNDYFKKNDWMELYNNTDKDVDIAGLYISDNLAKPTKYKVPADNEMLNTVIPAHGYKVIWCDKLDNKSEMIHTTFKLDADGGDLLVLKKDAEGGIAYADTVSYTFHLGQQSFGRYPDAGTTKYVMDKPTPGKSNIYTSYAVEYVAPIPQPEPDAIAMVRDGGMTIVYNSGVINIKSEDYAISSYEMFNTSGIKMSVDEVRNSGNFVTLNVRNLPKGIYVVTATNTNGDECKIKFIIK